MLDEICSVFAFSEQVFQAAFLQFGDTAKEIWGVQRGISPLWRWVSNRGASIPVGTRFSAGKSSVLYLCFRLTRERGRRTLQQGRVWQQTLFRGSRTGGFCDAGYGTNAGFLRSKIRLSGKGSRGIKAPIPPQRRRCFSASSVFPCRGSWSFSRAG